MDSFFSRYYDKLMTPLERRGFYVIRKKLLTKAKGHVLEIGSGTGINFPLYQHVNKVTAIEPSEAMRKQSLPRIAQSHVPIEVLDADAEKLPFNDDAFDSVVATLVFCTIPNSMAALQEIRRVLKPGGSMYLFEHVRLEQPFLGKIQDWMTPMWKHLAEGCHLNRNTLDDIEKAGFTVVEVQEHYKKLFVVIEANNA